mmetsp:Transcript_36639/g.121367  ORF Transcript_36639/g.121367 Transcript_36639/m.121367 type:complete len:262 (-) Transcript_36639:713-1498(-)
MTGHGSRVGVALSETECLSTPSDLLTRPAQRRTPRPRRAGPRRVHSRLSAVRRRLDRGARLVRQVGAPLERRPLASVQHLLQLLRADAGEVLLVCVVYGAGRDPLLRRADLRRAQQVDHRDGRSARKVGCGALAAHPLLSVPEGEARVEEDELQLLLELERGERLVQRVCKGVEAFRRSGGELWREQEDGGDLALVDAVELADLLPEGLVELLDAGGSRDGVGDASLRQPRLVDRVREGADLHVDDDRLDPRVSRGEHLLV